MEQNTQEAIVAHEEHLSVPTVPTRTTRGAFDTPPTRLRCVSNKTIRCADTNDGRWTVVDALRCYSTIPEDAVRRVKKALGLAASSKISERETSGRGGTLKSRMIVCKKMRPIGLVAYPVSGGSNNVYVLLQ